MISVPDALGFHFLGLKLKVVLANVRLRYREKEELFGQRLLRRRTGGLLR